MSLPRWLKARSISGRRFSWPFFIFIFKNKKNSKIYAGLEKLRNWGPVAHPRGDRDLYIRSVGDRDLYVRNDRDLYIRKNNYMLTGGAGPPFKGRQGTG